jgi:Trk K+ transport system NAD-binding subunit
VEAGAILEIVGTSEALEQACKILGASPLRQRGPFLIAGFGEVGRKVHELLTDAGEEVRVIERQPGPGVDIAGNVFDPYVLERAGLAETRGAVLAVDSDDSTLFATVVIRDTAPDVPVIARVNHSRNLDNIYRAGADYALSISDVSGEMLSARLLRHAARARDEYRAILRTPARASSGRALRDLDVRQFGCSVIAIRRGGAFVASLGADSWIEEGDELFLCGSADAAKAAAAAC